MIIIPENLELHKPNKKLDEIIEKTEIDEKILLKTNSDFHDICVVQNNFGKFLKYKETYQAGWIKSKHYTGNLPYINYFLIPYLINKNVEKILLIGFGSGILVNQYEKLFKKLKKIDIVDIEENVFHIAKKYFNFKESDKMNFHLQDALVFLKTTKTKYDLIVVDVADNYGIDDRFISDEYFELINNHLKKSGLFVANLPSSRDIFNKKNVFLNILKKFQSNFKEVKLYNGETSNRFYYKTFFNIDEIVYDITNAILISANDKITIDKPDKEIKNVCKYIDEYLKDDVSI